MLWKVDKTKQIGYTNTNVFHRFPEFFGRSTVNPTQPRR